MIQCSLSLSLKCHMWPTPMQNNESPFLQLSSRERAVCQRHTQTAVRAHLGGKGNAKGKGSEQEESLLLPGLHILQPRGKPYQNRHTLRYRASLISTVSPSLPPPPPLHWTFKRFCCVIHYIKYFALTWLKKNSLVCMKESTFLALSNFFWSLAFTASWNLKRIKEYKTWTIINWTEFKFLGSLIFIIFICISKSVGWNLVKLFRLH